MKPVARSRNILHVDLDSFFVSVERSLDKELRAKPLVVGGEGSLGVVAAASPEARAAGVRPGQSITAARRLCPDAVFRAGDLEAYARVSEDVTALLLSASRRVERPSIDEAYVDLTPESPQAPAPVQVAERLKDEFQRRLGLDASFGLAGSRLAARTASSMARPRGLLIVLPGYEHAFLARQPLSVLAELPAHLDKALADAGFTTLGDVAAAEEATLAAAVGKGAAARLRSLAAGQGDPPIAIAASPSWIQDEAVVRDRAADAAALAELLDGLVHRACRRLRPFGLAASSLSVEVERGAARERRSEDLWQGCADEAALAGTARTLATPLFEPARSVRRLVLRLYRLHKPSRQEPLFPAPGAVGQRSALL